MIPNMCRNSFLPPPLSLPPSLSRAHRHSIPQLFACFLDTNNCGFKNKGVLNLRACCRSKTFRWILDGDSSLSPAAGHGACMSELWQTLWHKPDLTARLTAFQDCGNGEKEREDMTRMSETHLSNFLNSWVICWSQIFLCSKLFKDTLHFLLSFQINNI